MSGNRKTAVHPAVGIRSASKFRFCKELARNKYLYAMLFPVMVYFILFDYVPMYGSLIAFKNFNPYQGVWGSPWVGFKYFEQFFQSYYFFRLLRNTLLLSVYSLIFIFPAAIVFAMLLNEIKNRAYKSVVQTLSYLPHFVSLVVVCGMILDFLQPTGIINRMIVALGFTDKPLNFMILPEWFRTIYIGSGLWQSIGWNSIIYLAALSGINPSLYEAAYVDGAGRWKQAWNITLPGILPTIVILLILNIGSLMSVGFDKIILLYNPATYETADVISTFVYRRGILETDYSFSSAVGLFNSVVNFALLIIANRLSRKTTESSLW